MPPSSSASASPAIDPRRNDAVTRVAVLGATGSIGVATIEVLRHLDRTDPTRRWHLTSASCHRSVDDLVSLCRTPDGDDSPATVMVASDPQVAPAGDNDSPVRNGGPEALVEIASDDRVDVVVAAIVGSAGLASTLAAAKAGKRIALANKEALVVAGPLLRQAVTASGAELLPIDSEHSAIFQALGGSDQAADVAARRAAKLILTASGGPFRTWTKEQMTGATPDQAMRHPTWDMGPKITIDSATMMNKALEIIEARWLFDVPADAIEVMIHPQSIIHSMVQMPDGSVMAQMSPPDMKMPIQLALTYPRRLPGIAPTIDFGGRYDMTLEAVDRDRFPAIDLGFEVARVGGTAGAVVNAANERAVAAFIDGELRLTDIVPTVRRVLAAHDHDTNPTLDDLMNWDRWARDEVVAAKR